MIFFFALNLFYTDIRRVLGKTKYYFLYTLLEYLTFSFILYKSINNKNFRKFIILCSCLFSVFLIFYYSNSEIIRIDSIPIGVESILLITFIVYFFYVYFSNLNNGLIYNNAYFWLITGILIYIGFTFFFNILANSLNKEHFDKYFYFSYLGDILKNILFSVAIIFFAKKSHVNTAKKPYNVPHLDMI